MGFFKSLVHNVNKSFKKVGHGITGIAHKTLNPIGHTLGQGFKGVSHLVKGGVHEGLHLLHTGENAFKGITGGVAKLLNSPMLIIAVIAAGIGIVMIKT